MGICKSVCADEQPAEPQGVIETVLPTGTKSSIDVKSQSTATTPAVKSPGDIARRFEPAPAVLTPVIPPDEPQAVSHEELAPVSHEAPVSPTPPVQPVQDAVTAVQPSAQYQVALKAPHGKHMQCVWNNQWAFCDDIHLWIQGIYANHKFDGYVVYNDEVEGHTVSSSHGHCKGILAWNSQVLTWLIHSVPKFPSSFDTKSVIPVPDIAEAELIYGQSFIFLQLDVSLLNDILVQLKIMNPYVYISTLSLANAPSMMGQGSIRELALGQNIIHIAKAGHWGSDIYEHVATRCGASFVAETWVRGHECKDSEKVKDVHQIAWPTGHRYKRTQDHSKYACSAEHVYVGDINRMTSQFHRGGGGVVIQDEAVAKLFRDIMS